MIISYASYIKEGQYSERHRFTLYITISIKVMLLKRTIAKLIAKLYQYLYSKYEWYNKKGNPC